jgi:aminoglycoside/choline kinase family phosphotransferase
MHDKRKDLLSQWAAAQLNIDKVELVTVSGDASFRRYFRFTNPDKNAQNKTIIAVDAPPEFEDNHSFQKIALILKQNNLLVPEINFIDHKLGFLLLSDLGDELYLPYLNEKSADQLYQSAMNAIISMLLIPAVQLSNVPKYDSHALNLEMDLFDEWFIKQHLKIELTETETQTIKATFSALTENALTQPHHFVHRDYHSRNLMICGVQTPALIDFQDAVVGPITYDLVSLLKDCYIQWPEKQVESWCYAFYQRLIDLQFVDYPFSTFQKQFDLMGMQRHIKVLGIFCRLNYRDHKPDYLKDLQLTFDYLVQAVAKYPEFSAFYQFLLKRVHPLLQQKK